MEWMRHVFLEKIPAQAELERGPIRHTWCD
jgi:hypothetical protein